MNQLINREFILKPLSADNPTGADCRLDVSPGSLYYKIKDARNRARNIERKLLNGETGCDPMPDWLIVLEVAIEILSIHSKDLEVVVWLIESLIRRNGFTGLYEGLALLHQLITLYWDSLYPTLDQNDLDLRLAPLIGLNGEDADGTLIQPITEQFITEGKTIGPYVLWEYQQAIELEKISDPNVLEKKLEQGCVRLVDVKKAVAESSQKFYADLFENLSLCIEEYQSITSFLEEKCGNNAPPSSNIRRTLELFRDHIKFILSDAPFMINDQSEFNKLKEEQNGQSYGPRNEKEEILSERINSRQEALINLIKVADFFKKTEPHSPIPYLLERAVRWGNLPLPELLLEMIADESARNRVYELSGIR